MNWGAIAAIGEVIGALAVLVTLLYLARQMHQANSLMKEQASYNILQNQLSYYDIMARDPELVNVVYSIEKEDLKATTKAKAESHATAEFFRWQWEYLRAHEEIFSDADLPIAGMRREWDRACFSPYWVEQKYIFHPKFVDFVERNIVAREDET